MTIRRMSFAPLTTGPPANTVSPADSALVVVLAPFFLTTVSLTICQVQVVPSAALITTSLPLITDWMVPRSNASVWKPVLFWKVNSPSTPPSRRSRPSAHRTRAGGVVELLAAVLSAEFSSAACKLEADEAELAAAVPSQEPPDTATRAIPPPARKPARVTSAPQRNNRFLRDRVEEGSAGGPPQPPAPPPPPPPTPPTPPPPP